MGTNQRRSNRCCNIVFRKIEELNKIIKVIFKTSKLNVIYQNDKKCMYSKENYLIILKSTVYLYYYDVKERKRKYYFSKLDSEEERLYIKGAFAYRVFKQYVKQDLHISCKELGIEDFDELGVCAASLYVNENYNFKTTLAFEYDLNSAFPFIALNYPMPIKFLRKNDFCKGSEIGFSKLEGRLLLTTSKNFKSDYVFQSGDIEGFKRFFQVHYDKKKNAKTPLERQKYKDIMNMTIGYLQLINPFLRACIIDNLNNYIHSIIEQNQDYVIFSNCDSLVTTKDIKNRLNIGKEIGQFKIEKENKLFYLSNNNYQWEDELPIYRGIPKNWFKEYEKINNEKFELSKKSVSLLNTLYNIYRFNFVSMQFEKVR